MPLTIEHLDAKHNAYDLEFWKDLDALYRGGKAFRNRIGNFLHRNPVETPDIYEQRKRESAYISYLGPVVDYYSAWLFSGEFHVRALDGETTIDPDPIYSEFREDIGGDCDLKSFLRERFTRALIDQRSHWICELPAAADLGEWPLSKAEYEEAGLKKARLTKVDAEQLYYWEVDAKGKLLWCVVHSCTQVRKSIADLKPVTVETWKVYDQENCTVFAIEFKPGERPSRETEITPVAQYKHGFLQVPLVTLQIPEGLWIANRVYDPQASHFRLGSALDWSIKRTCYAMPVFNVEDSERPPTMGAGYFIMIGKDEKMSWSAPPTGQFDTISKEADARRNDIYRIVNQMALGLDNNAETVGRSADSKSIDNAATRIMLNAYGSIVVQAIEETYEIVSDAFGDTETKWSIEGFNGYDTATAPEVIANAQNAQLLMIPSKTYAVEIKTKAAIATVPEASQQTKDAIRKEISESITAAPDEEMLGMTGAANALADKQITVQAKQAAAQLATKPPPSGGKVPGKPKASSSRPA